MPPDLVETCIRAGTPEDGVCARCGTPLRRKILRTVSDAPESYLGSAFHRGKTRDAVAHMREPGRKPRTASLITTGWEAACTCGAAAVPATVLDPLGGSGTVGMVASVLGRESVLIEANPRYVELAEERCRANKPGNGDGRGKEVI